MTSLYAISISYIQKPFVVYTTLYNITMPHNWGSCANKSLSFNKGRQPTKQEPDVLSLAEYIALQKTATTKDKYANTLLFNTTNEPWILVVKPSSGPNNDGNGSPKLKSLMLNATLLLIP